MSDFEAIVIGTSLGGNSALETMLAPLPASFPLAIVVVLHQPPAPQAVLIGSLAPVCQLPVQEAQESERLQPGNIYLAAPNYHLLIEPDKTFSFSTDKKVNYARPAIDPLFMTAAEAYRQHLIGVLLTGANRDGTAGLRTIQAQGGCTIVQDPKTAESPTMPQSAITAGVVDHIVPLTKLSTFISQLVITPIGDEIVNQVN